MVRKGVEKGLKVVEKGAFYRIWTKPKVDWPQNAPFLNFVPKMCVKMHVFSRKIRLIRYKGV